MPNIRIYRNTSDRRWGKGRLPRITCLWLGPIFVTVSK